MIVLLKFWAEICCLGLFLVQIHILDVDSRNDVFVFGWAMGNRHHEFRVLPLWFLEVSMYNFWSTVISHNDFSVFQTHAVS